MSITDNNSSLLFFAAVGMGSDSGSDRGQTQTPGLFTPSGMSTSNREQGPEFESNPYHDRLPDNAYSSSYSANQSSSSRSNSNIVASQPYRPDGEYSSQSMAGIGNPHFAKTEKSWMQIAREKVSSAGSTVTAGATGLTGGSSASGKWIMNNISSLGSRGSADEGRGSSLILPHEQDFSEHSNDNISSLNGSASVFAASSVSADRIRYRDTPGNTGDGSAWSTGGGGGASRPPGTTFGRGGTAASDGEYERVLVASLCEPGGLKATPAEDTLKAFLLTAGRLSPELIGASLIEQLNSDHWQSRNKALVVIGCFSSACSGCEDHVAWWRRRDSVEAVESMLHDSKASVRTQAARTVRSLRERETDSSEASSADLADSDRDRFSDTHVSESHAAVPNTFVAKETTEEVSLIDWEELGPQIPTSIPMAQPAVHSSSSLITFTSREDELREQMEIAMLLDMDDGYHKRSKNERVSAVSVSAGDSANSSSIFDQMALSKHQSNGDHNLIGDTASVQHSVASVNSPNSGGLATMRRNVDVAEQMDIFAGLTVLPTPAATTLPTAPARRSELDIFNDYAPPAPVLSSLIPLQVQGPSYTPAPLLPNPSQYLPNQPQFQQYQQQQQPQQQQQYQQKLQQQQPLQYQQQQQYQYQSQPGPVVDASLSGFGYTTWTGGESKGRAEVGNDTNAFQIQGLNGSHLSLPGDSSSSGTSSSSLNFMKGGSDSSRFVYQPVVDVNTFFNHRSAPSNPLISSGGGTGDFKFRDSNPPRASIPAPSTTQPEALDSFSFLSGVLKSPSAGPPVKK